MTIKISGKVNVWDLSGGEKNYERKYLNLDTTYGTLRDYSKKSVYDVTTSEGEQREASIKHVKKLRKSMSDGTYTPVGFSAVVSNEGCINYIKGGKAEIELTESNKLILLDGGHRVDALEILRSENETLRRKVDNQPIPLMVYLDPEKRKLDFCNLQNRLPVKKSHLLNLSIDRGNKLPYFTQARDIALLLNKSINSPFYNMIKFAGGCAPVEFSNLVTDRKSDIVGSLLFSTKILENNKQSIAWYNDQLNDFWKFIKTNTTCSETGNLLCSPPRGPKGVAQILLSVFNQFIYRLYLLSRTKPNASDLKILKEALEVYNEAVAGDLGGKRRSNLTRNYAQILFQDIYEDESSPVACHFGIPVSLIVMTSPSAFSVDAPPKPIHPTTSKPKAESVDEFKQDSDTDPLF